jgi:hypothetical protein
MTTVQELFYILGTIALTLFIFLLAMGLFLAFVIKRRIDRLSHKVELLGTDLGSAIFKGKRYFGLLSGGLVYKLLGSLLNRYTKRKPYDRDDYR